MLNTMADFIPTFTFQTLVMFALTNPTRLASSFQFHQFREVTTWGTTSRRWNTFGASIKSYKAQRNTGQASSYCKSRSWMEARSWTEAQSWGMHHDEGCTVMREAFTWREGQPCLCPSTKLTKGYLVLCQLCKVNKPPPCPQIIRTPDKTNFGLSFCNSHRHGLWIGLLQSVLAFPATNVTLFVQVFCRDNGLSHTLSLVSLRAPAALNFYYSFWC
jgi:hypothetical protein